MIWLCSSCIRVLIKGNLRYWETRFPYPSCGLGHFRKFFSVFYSYCVWWSLLFIIQSLFLFFYFKFMVFLSYIFFSFLFISILDFCSGLLNQIMSSVTFLYIGQNLDKRKNEKTKKNIPIFIAVERKILIKKNRLPNASLYPTPQPPSSPPTPCVNFNQA